MESVHFRQNLSTRHEKPNGKCHFLEEKLPQYIYILSAPGITC
jgi:hypothetical protein